jgi:hypothetical protein
MLHRFVQHRFRGLVAVALLEDIENAEIHGFDLLGKVV